MDEFRHTRGCLKKCQTLEILDSGGARRTYEFQETIIETIGYGEGGIIGCRVFTLELNDNITVSTACSMR